MVLLKQQIIKGKAWRAASCLSLFLTLGLLNTSPVRAQSADLSSQTAASQDQEAHIDRLENEIQTLSRAVFKGEKPPSDIANNMQGNTAAAATAQANLEVRLSQIETSLQTLTGKVEQQGFAQQQTQKTLADLQARVAATAAAPAATAPATNAMPPQPATSPSGGADVDTHSIMQSSSPAASTTPPVALPNPNAAAPANSPTQQQLGKLKETTGGTELPVGNDATSQYEAAFSNLHDRKYDDAEKGFTAFLAKYPDNALAPNAQYWLGETYYARNDFQQAARVFAVSYQKYPKGPKGADSLLKLALSLAGLDKKTDACLSLTQLKHEYATGAGPVLDRANQEAKTLACP